VNGTIQVRYAGVQQLAATLQTTAERLAATVEPVVAAGRVTSGSAAVDAELHRIADQAGHLLTDLAEALARDAAALGGAVTTYADTDVGIADVAEGRP
jgi:ABC-type transporter Mla subunit MlaD